MYATVLKAVTFLAGFIVLLWLGMEFGETHTAPILVALINYVAIWQFLFAPAVAEGLSRHYRASLLANFLPADRLAVTPKFVRVMAVLFSAGSLAAWLVL